MASRLRNVNRRTETEGGRVNDITRVAGKGVDDVIEMVMCTSDEVNVGEVGAVVTLWVAEREGSKLRDGSREETADQKVMQVMISLRGVVSKRNSIVGMISKRKE